MGEKVQTILVYGMSNTKGGVENFLLTLQHQLKQDFRFVFLFENCNCIYEDIILENNGIIEFYDNSSNNHSVQAIEDILAKYAKVSSLLYLNLSDLKHENVYLIIAAKKRGYDIVTHAHGAMLAPIQSMIHRVTHYCIVKLGRFLLSGKTSVKLAVSKRAGDYNYGKLNYEIVSPGINVEKFRFDLQVRDTMRNKYNLDDGCFVIGFIGRLVEIKNPLFIIDVLADIISTTDYQAKLIIVGDGPLRREIEEYASKKNVISDVIITGMVNNVNDYLQAMDCILGSSFSEGFPLSFIEAQVSGVSCICATENYPPELAKTSFFKFVPLKDGSEAWARSIIELIQDKEKLFKERCSRKDSFDFFDEKYIANSLKEIFIKNFNISSNRKKSDESKD